MTGRHWECLLQSSNICFCWLAQLRVRCCDLLLLALLRRLCRPLVVGGQGAFKGRSGCGAWQTLQAGYRDVWHTLGQTVVVVKCAAAAPAGL